jgi:hypothetical protein
MKQFEDFQALNHLSQSRIKELRLELRGGDPQAARELLSHSLRVGHRRLSVRRFLIAYALGVERLDEHLAFIRAITKKMTNSDIRQIVSDVASKLNRPDDFFEAIEHLLLNEEWHD